MLILLTIFLFLSIPVAMLILHVARPKFSIQGFLVILAVLAGWSMVLFARSDIPKTITLLSWQPAVYFPNSPTLLIDEISWYFSIALMSLALISVITSIAHLGQSLKPGQEQINNRIEVNEVQNQIDIETAANKFVPIEEIKTNSNWQSWAGIFVLTSLGLVAVTAGNVLTLLLAWAGLDLIELTILLSQALQNKFGARIILAFSARMAGIGMVLLACIIPWSRGASLNINEISRTTSIYLLLAAGLRLGVFPLQLPLTNLFNQRRELGTILRLVPAAASFILLVRVANTGILGTASPILLSFTAITGLYAGIQWVTAEDELTGQPYWLLGTSSLAIASAILNQPFACIAWSIASLLSGGLLFSMSIRHKNLLPIVVLGFVGFSTLPFSPTWLGTDLYQYPWPASNLFSPPLLFLVSFAFLLIHSLFLAGFFRFILRCISPLEKQIKVHIEPWVWFLYPIGLIIILVTHYLIGMMLYPSMDEIPVTGWIMGIIAVILSGIIWYLPMRYSKGFRRTDQSAITSAIPKFLSLEWLYSFLWRLFRELSRFAAIISTILEGDGGILWAFVLFALIFVFLLR
jgi:hypothetical protein